MIGLKLFDSTISLHVLLNEVGESIHSGVSSGSVYWTVFILNSVGNPGSYPHTVTEAVQWGSTVTLKCNKGLK